MSRPAERLAELDRVVHEPVRLAILTALSACRRADFMYLCRLTGGTSGNLSTHLARLAQADLVRIEKGFSGSFPHTTVVITAKGRRAVDDHWRLLDELRQGILKGRCRGAQRTRRPTTAT